MGTVKGSASLETEPRLELLGGATLAVEHPPVHEFPDPVCEAKESP
jgi:hypothetical protein